MASKHAPIIPFNEGISGLFFCLAYPIHKSLTIGTDHMTVQRAILTLDNYLIEEE